MVERISILRLMVELSAFKLDLMVKCFFTLIYISICIYEYGCSVIDLILDRS